MKVLAQLTGGGPDTGLALGSRTLSLARLAATARESLARLPRTILIEVELDGDDVLALGDVKPHPRTAALRAVGDGRPHDALEAIASLGALVEDDLELRVAEVAALSVARRLDDAVAAFERLADKPTLDARTLEAAFRALAIDASLTARCADTFLKGLERVNSDGPVLSHALRLVDVVRWPPSIVERALREVLATPKLSLNDVAELEPWLVALASRDPASAVTWRATVDARRTTLAADDARRQARVLASRPDFAELEAAFGVTLPPALRVAWHDAYAGGPTALDFILVKKGKLDELSKLAKTLSSAMRAVLARTPAQLLPFAHAFDDRFFVLDLAEPSAGDFPVLAVSRHRGEDLGDGFPSSAAWLAAHRVSS